MGYGGYGVVAPVPGVVATVPGIAVTVPGIVAPVPGYRHCWALGLSSLQLVMARAEGQTTPGPPRPEDSLRAAGSISR